MGQGLCSAHRILPRLETETGLTLAEKGRLCSEPQVQMEAREQENLPD